MNNSVLIENTADPDILKDGDDYYLVYAIREGALMFRGFQVFHSTDLTNWSKPKVVLDFKDFPWANAMGWAPSMAKMEDKYYLAFCADQQIGLAVSDSPWGPFRDMVGEPLLVKNSYGHQTIDPCLFSEDGHLYLFWGQGKCQLAELDVSGKTARLKEKPVCISNEFYYQSSCSKPFDASIYNEAPDIVKIGERYLLSWSIYDYRDPRYSVRYAWADNIYGPYIQPVDENMELDNILVRGQGNVLGTGHACVTEYQGEYYLFYHTLTYPRKGYRRDTRKGKIHFLTQDKLKVYVCL